jgi:hypothetical protein
MVMALRLGGNRHERFTAEAILSPGRRGLRGPLLIVRSPF